MKKTKRNWAFIFSPYILLMLVLSGEYIYARLFAKDKDLLLYLVLALELLLPVILIALAADIFLKAILKNSSNKAMYIWTIELMLTGIVFIIFTQFHG